MEVSAVQQGRSAEASAARKRQVLIQLMTRLVLAQAALAAAIGLFYSRRHMPSVVITMLLVAAVFALAFVVRSGTHAAWIIALSFEFAFVLFGLSRFFAARYLGGTLFAIIVSGALLHPAIASAYAPAAGRGRGGRPRAWPGRKRLRARLIQSARVSGGCRGRAGPEGARSPVEVASLRSVPQGI